MKNAFLYLVISLSGLALNGQTVNLDSIFEPRLSGEMYKMKVGIIGKQFYNDDWAESDIKLSSGEVAFNKFLKYNGLLDEVIWLRSDLSGQVKLEKQFIDEFTFKDFRGKPVRFKRIRVRLPQMTDSTDIFAEVLSEKSASLYVFRHIRIIESINRVENGALYSFDRLAPQPVYILKLPDNETLTFRRISPTALLKALPKDYKAAVKKIIQQNFLSVRSEDDLVKLVRLI